MPSHRKLLQIIVAHDLSERMKLSETVYTWTHIWANSVSLASFFNCLFVCLYLNIIRDVV